jgi:soluble lytic murein transglycosylase
MKAESQREWLFIVRGQPDDVLLLAADYARRVALYDRAVNTAERTKARHDYSLRYMAPFRTEFDAASRSHDVDVTLLYGIARQESRFSPDIVSSAGAVGLMQLMPGTARWVAHQLGRKDYRAAAIADVELNTLFGAYYFKYWLERLDRLPALAAAAYNAGPGRAQAWRPPVPLEGAVWVETIPFNETRDYVKKVLANSMIYAQAFGGAPQSLTARLGVVAPRGAVVIDPMAARTE